LRRRPAGLKGLLEKLPGKDSESGGKKKGEEVRIERETERRERGLIRVGGSTLKEEVSEKEKPCQKRKRGSKKNRGVSKKHRK